MSQGSARPVVIQTMWRTGGTYLAFALRDQNAVALFYEPLHEDYSRYAKADWDGFAAAGAGASRGHPTKSFHYLTDFPFLANAGVAGHRPDFAFERFVLDSDDEHPQLAAYLNGLMRHAEVSGRQPLFKFCRGFLRQKWLARLLHPTTVFLARSPQGMLASYAKLGAGAYFHSGYLRIVRENRRHRLFAPIHDYLTWAHPDYASASEALVASDALASTASPETRHDVFLFFWALAMAAHADASYLMLDAGALGSDPRSSAEALRRHAGLHVDLHEAVALDPGEPGLARFRQPEVFGRWLSETLCDSHLDTSVFPSRLRVQFDALVALD
jgi:hypothetical protein